MIIPRQAGGGGVPTPKQKPYMMHMMTTLAKEPTAEKAKVIQAHPIAEPKTK
jgi:hypothetical protein